MAATFSPIRRGVGVAPLVRFLMLVVLGGCVVLAVTLTVDV